MSQNRANGKRFLAAIEAEIKEREERNKKLSEGQQRWATLKEIAGKLLDGAAEGNTQAIKELADRLDGKPAQSMALTDPDGGRLVINLVDAGRAHD